MKQTIDAWRDWLQEDEVRDEVLAEILKDPRRGVQQLAKRYRNQKQRKNLSGTRTSCKNVEL